MRTLLLTMTAAVALRAGDGALERMRNAKLNVAQRNDACFELLAQPSAELARTMREMLADEQVRQCAVKYLREAGAVEEIMTALKDANPEVRAAAVASLGSPLSPELAAMLARAARDENLLVAASAVEALSREPSPASQRMLLQLAARDTASGRMAFEKLIDAGHAGALPLAREWMSRDDVASRLAAIRGLGALGDRSDLEKLRAAALQTGKVSPNGRGFGLLPPIDLGRAAQTAILRIEGRELHAGHRTTE